MIGLLFKSSLPLLKACEFRCTVNVTCMADYVQETLGTAYYHSFLLYTFFVPKFVHVNNLLAAAMKLKSFSIIGK